MRRYLSGFLAGLMIFTSVPMDVSTVKAAENDTAMEAVSEVSEDESAVASTATGEKESETQERSEAETQERSEAETQEKSEIESTERTSEETSETEASVSESEEESETEEESTKADLGEAPESASGTCGDSATWSYSGGTLTISGSGAMYDYDSSTMGWKTYAKDITSLVISDGITKIGSGCFEGTKITSVEIPDSVTEIGTSAFQSCESLITVKLPERLNQLNGMTFRYCTSLNKINIPKSLKKAGGSAEFYECPLSEITFEEGITQIVDNLFFGANFETVTIPDSVTKIGINAFNDNDKLKEIVIPNSVTEIGGCAFANCKSLTTVKLPSGLKQLNGMTFRYCTSLQKINIPKSLEKAGGSAEFYECPLSEITFEEGITQIADNLFRGSNLESVTIPGSVTKIGISAFQGCDQLKEIIISDSVTEIGTSAFQECKALTSVKLPSELKRLQGMTFRYCTSLQKINIPRSLEYTETSAEFYECPLSEITFEEGITQIADNLFRGSNLESVTIPGSVTKIGISAFQGCDQLKEIIIPDSVTEIGTSAFQECKALTSVRLSLGLKQLNGMTFRYCTSLNKINIPKSLKEVGSSAEFYECPLTEITFEERTTQIADNLFRGSNIESVTIPGSVTKIGIYAFYGCKKLKEIVIPDNVTEIGCSAFERCESLTTVQLPSGLKQLNGQTFNSCTSLNKINIPKSLEKTDMGPEFNGCPLSEITFEEGIIRIADNLFSYSKLENVTIPSTVQRIGKRSFKNCEELQTIYIPERTTIIDDSSFENCGNSVKILAKTGTYAEEYADEQGIQFESNGVWDYGLNLRYDGFSFVNTYNSFGYEKGYKIPDERVDEVYNCNKYWKNKNSLKNEKNKEWFGSCFGMCIMAIKFSNGEINVSDYISDASSGHNVVNANDIYYDFTKFDDEDNDEKRKIKCIQKDGELTKAIERYQIMQSSYQVNQRMRDYQKMMEKKKNNLQDYFADYVGYLRRASELEEKKKEQWLVNLHWKEDRVDKGKVKTVNTGHIVAVDTSRYPVESENGWIRIFIYDPNYPYWGKSVEGVDPQFTNKDAMSCYIDVNIETGKWYTSHMITYKGNRMHIGQYEYEDKPEKADNGDIYFFPASIVPLFNGEKYDTMYDAPGKNVTFYGDNISVYNADNSELVFELKNGEETVVGDAVQDKNYFSGSTNATSNAGIVFLADGNYSIIADDTEVSFGQDGNYFTLASSGKIRVDMSSATDVAITSLSGNNTIEINIGDKTSNEKYTAIQTSLSIDETPCKISLKEDKLTVDTDISQKLDVEIITEEGEGKISDVPVDKLDDFNLRETEVETDLGEVLKSDVPADGVIPEGIWIAGVKDQDYTGARITQDIRVYDGKKRLREKTDYTISYKNNTKAYELAEGDAGYQAAKAPTMIVTTKGNYTGKITVTFKIKRVSVAEENAEIVIDAVTSAYNKKNQAPDPTVTWKGKKLSKGKDYTVSYQDVNGNATACKDIGTYQIVVSGNGNFCGNRNVAFTIVDPSQLTLLSKAKISKIPAQIYTGNEITVESMLAAGTLSKFEVKVGNKVLTQNTDYTLGYRNNTAVGTATVIIKAAEGSAYSGQKLVTFKINGIAISKAVVDKVPDQTYTGETIEPEFVVRDASGKLLQKDVNYTVAYTNQVNAGKATATITGIGDYSGTRKVTYKIQPLGIGGNEKIVVNGGSEITVNYEKGGAKPVPVVTYNQKKLRAGVDYTLSYNNNNAAEESNPAKQPTIVIKGKGNFTGTINQTFTIKKQDLGKVTLSLVDMTYKAGKSNIYKTKYKLIDTNGQALSANKDYDAKTVQYTYVNDTVLENGQTVRTAGSVVGDKDIIPNGTQIQLTVYAVAGGNYTEKATGTYMIGSTVLDINKATVKVPTQQYTGKEIMLHVQKDTNDKTGYTITYGKTKTALVEGTDYEVVGYSNNINKGKAKMTIRGLGKYSGTKIITFTIKERNANDWWSNIINRFASIFNR